LIGNDKNRMAFLKEKKNTFRKEKMLAIKNECKLSF
jgi:hypothetical protein